MKISMFLLVLCTYIGAFSLKAADLRKLPIGDEKILQLYLATNVTEIEGVVYQTDDFGEDTGLWRVNAGGRYTNYSEVISRLKTIIIGSVEAAVLTAEYDPSLPVSFFFPLSHSELNPRTGFEWSKAVFYSVSEFAPVMKNGKLTVPTEVLESMRVQIERNVFMKFTKWVTSAKVTSIDRATGSLLFHKDTRYDPTEDDIYVGGDEGVLYVHKRFLTEGGPAGSVDVTIQITFEDGIVLTYDGSGNLQNEDYLNPRLSISTTGIISVVGGIPGEVLQVECSTDLKVWTPWKNVKVATSTVVAPEPIRFYRIRF